MSIAFADAPPPGRRVALLLIAVAGFLVYANSLTTPPHFDDDHVFAEVSPAGMVAPLRSPRRWLAQLTFAANYAVHGQSVYGYHLVNVFLHVGNGLLLFLLLERLLRGRGVAERRAALAAGAAALFFVLHPLTTQSVTYIAQRYNSLVGIFYLSALLLYLVARDRRAAGAAFGERAHLLPYAGAVVAGTAAMFCKEFAVSLPLVLLLLERFFPVPTPAPWRRRLAYLGPLLATGLLVPLVYVVLPALAGHVQAVAGGGLADAALPRWAPAAISRSLYFRTQLKVVVAVYLRLIVVPWGQSIDHNLGAGGPWCSPVTIACGLLLAALAVGGWLWRRRVPLAGFGILWFLIALAPTSSIITNTEAVAEHRVYLPLMGAAFVLAAGLSRWRPRRWLAPVAGGLLLLAGLTVARNRVWASDVALWHDAAARYPENPRAWFALGHACQEAHRWDDAVAAYRHVLDLRPDHVQTLNNLALMLQDAGRLDDAVTVYRRALRVAPDHWRSWYNLGLVFNRLGRPAEAVEATRRCLALRPTLVDAHHNLAMAREALGDPAAAVAAYQRAIELDPGYLPSRYHLGKLLLARGQPAPAAEQFAAIVAIAPDFADARELLARCRREAGP